MGFWMDHFDNYVIIGCKATYQESIVNAAGGDLSQEPAKNIAALLLLHRSAVADKVAERHPAFAETAAKIRENAKAFKELREAADEELGLALDFFQTPEIHDDPDYLILTAAYMSFLAPTGETVITACNNIIFELDKQDEIYGAANFLLPVLLWYLDVNGYRAAVQERFPEIKAQFDAERAAAAAEAARPGFIDTNMDTLVATGLGMADMAGFDLSTTPLDHAFLKELMMLREHAAKDITQQHPEFSEASDLIVRNNAAWTPQSSIPETLSQEMDVIMPFYASADWYQESEYLTLLLAYAGWGFRGEEHKETREKMMTLYETLEKKESMSGGAKAMLIIAMWFSDYKGYRGRVEALLPKYLEEKKAKDQLEQIEKRAKEREAQQAQYRARGVCQYCGGPFKGLLSKKCSSCGRAKDY